MESRELTSKKIHEASDMEPNTPDSASWTVKGGPWVASTANMAVIRPGRGGEKGRSRRYDAEVWGLVKEN
jgi:hypothetical protein